MSESTPGAKLKIEISSMSFVKFFLFSGLAFLLFKLLPLAALLFLACMLAVSLSPLLHRLQRRGLPRPLTVTLIATMMVVITFLILFVLLPSVFNQITNLVRDFPTLQADLFQQIGESPLKPVVEKIFQSAKIPEAEQILSGTLLIGAKTFEVLSEISLILIFSIYLLADQNRAYQWICDFFSPATRKKIEATFDETSPLIQGYVMGQLLTSMICGLYVYIILACLHVPGALTLAVLAGFFDIIPILGFFMAVIPAVFLALSVSSATAFLVFTLYVVYHFVENYLLVPYIYGSRMKVSSLVVLLALLVAGLLGGVLGAIAILPVVASYPIIERIWLKPYLGRQVIEKHATEEKNES